jgi:hypothetical protein
MSPPRDEGHHQTRRLAPSTVFRLNVVLGCLFLLDAGLFVRLHRITETVIRAEFAACWFLVALTTKAQFTDRNRGIVVGGVLACFLIIDFFAFYLR